MIRRIFNHPVPLILMLIIVISMFVPRARHTYYIYETEWYFKQLKADTNADADIHIRSNLASGRVIWPDLSFTEAEFEQEDYASYIRAAEGLFRAIRDGRVAPGLGYLIIRDIDNGLASWSEFSFAEADLKKVMHDGFVGTTEKAFALLKASGNPTWGDYILDMIEAQEIAWSDLSFSEDAFMEEMKTALMR